MEGLLSVARDLVDEEASLLFREVRRFFERRRFVPDFDKRELGRRRLVLLDVAPSLQELLTDTDREPDRDLHCCGRERERDLLFEHDFLRRCERERDRTRDLERDSERARNFMMGRERERA